MGTVISVQEKHAEVRTSYPRNVFRAKPVIELELFHDTVQALRAIPVGFELPSGLMPDQAKILVDSMNEKIVGVIVTPRV